MPGQVDKDLQRLRWHCRRGLLELDCIFEDYLERRYLCAPEAERQQFRALLDHQDPDLQAWLLHGDPSPPELALIVKSLRSD